MVSAEAEEEPRPTLRVDQAQPSPGQAFALTALTCRELVQNKKSLGLM